MIYLDLRKKKKKKKISVLSMDNFIYIYIKNCCFKCALSLFVDILKCRDGEDIKLVEYSLLFLKTFDYVIQEKGKSLLFQLK